MIIRAIPTLVLGDLPGHEFRGNQYQTNTGSASKAVSDVHDRAKGVVGKATYNALSDKALKMVASAKSIEVFRDSAQGKSQQQTVPVKSAWTNGYIKIDGKNIGYVGKSIGSGAFEAVTRNKNGDLAHNISRTFFTKHEALAHLLNEFASGKAGHL